MSDLEMVAVCWDTKDRKEQGCFMIRTRHLPAVGTVIEGCLMHHFGKMVNLRVVSHAWAVIGSTTDRDELHPEIHCEVI